MISLFFLFIIALLIQNGGILAVEVISSQELYEGIQSGRFDAVVDVRTEGEWKAGHIEGVFFMENLNLFGTSNQASTPSDLAGCEECVIAVYCRSGNRAGSAAQILENNGFQPPVYNALGTSQWVAAGYPLVMSDTVDDSVTPPCVGNEQVCAAAVPSGAPSFLRPSSIPSGVPSTSDPPSAYAERDEWCFAGNNMVHVQDARGSIPMNHLRIGDSVLVSGNHRYERIYGFAHYKEETNTEFLRIHTQGREVIDVSRHHMVFRGSQAVPASSLRARDQLVLVTKDGATVATTVTRVTTVSSRGGVYAPLTPSGTIVVNGILASSFVSLQHDTGYFWGTPFSYHWLAHTFEAPHRWYCAVWFDSCRHETYNQHGVSNWLATPKSIVDQMMNNNNNNNKWIMLFIAIVMGIGTTLLWCMDTIITTNHAPLSLMVVVVVVCVTMLTIRRVAVKTKRL